MQAGRCRAYGGGARDSTLVNCTLSGNSALYGGGTYQGSLNNCIAYYNSAPSGPNVSMSTCRYTCTTPLPTGVGNTTQAPQFVNAAGGNFHLLPTSPCIDAGSNAYMPAGPALDGVPRPLDGDCNGTALADMGCYEFASPSADSDGDGLCDSMELAADTSPVDAGSILRIVSLLRTGSMFQVQWQGGVHATQLLEIADDQGILSNDWHTIFTNRPPTSINTMFQDSGATGGVRFYRIKAAR